MYFYPWTHYNLIYPKRNNEKNFKFYKNPNEINSNTIIQNSSENITFIKKSSYGDNSISNSIRFRVDQKFKLIFNIYQ